MLEPPIPYPTSFNYTEANLLSQLNHNLTEQGKYCMEKLLTMEIKKKSRNSSYKTGLKKINHGLKGGKIPNEFKRHYDALTDVYVGLPLNEKTSRHG